MTTRLRKIKCESCGYTVRVTRSWMSVGMPVCPCGCSLSPEAPADLAYLGLIGPDDMPSPMWTAICRENGWEDAIQRRGAAAKAFAAKQLASGGMMGRRVAPADHCVYAGCGRWIAAGADVCSAGHAQHELVAAAGEACPF